MLTINFNNFLVRPYFLLCLFPCVQGETLQSLSFSQGISDFCVSNNVIYIISEDYTLYKYQHNELVKKIQISQKVPKREQLYQHNELVKEIQISQKVSKREQFGLINLPNITCYANNLYVHDGVNKVKVYDRDFNFIKTLPIVPLDGFIYLENDKLIYTIYVNGIGKIYYYDLVKNQNVFISDANNEEEINYRFITKAVFFNDKYYLYLMSMGKPTNDNFFVFDSKFKRVKGDKSILDVFSEFNNQKLIIENNTVFYEKLIVHWDNKKEERTFKTIFCRYDIETEKNNDIIKLDNVVVKDFFLENGLLYYLDITDGRIYSQRSERRTHPTHP